ncbi:MAG: hypothetical protein ACRD8U_07740 [Pyrinomonadaceae bacterium]
MKKVAVDKFHTSALVSNVLVVSSVMLAALPMLLGDQLGLAVSSLVRDASSVFQEISTSLQMLLS